MQARRPQIPNEQVISAAQPSAMPEATVQQFTEDEVQNLREIFDLFDKEKSGQIAAKDLETIMGSLQRDPAEVREFIEGLAPDGTITFDDFIQLMQSIENKIVNSDHQPEQE